MKGNNIVTLVRFNFLSYGSCLKNNNKKSLISQGFYSILYFNLFSHQQGARQFGMQTAETFGNVHVGGKEDDTCKNEEGHGPGFK